MFHKRMNVYFPVSPLKNKNLIREKIEKSLSSWIFLVVVPILSKQFHIKYFIQREIDINIGKDILTCLVFKAV